MSLLSLTVGDLKRLSVLVSRKEQLQAELAEINRKFDDFTVGPAGGGATRNGRRKGPRRKPTAARKVTRKVTKTRKRSSGLKSKIITALKKVGPGGIHLKDLAKKLKTNENSLRTWFYTTAKKVPEIKAVKPATFAWAE